VRVRTRVRVPVDGMESMFSSLRYTMCSTLWSPAGA